MTFVKKNIDKGFMLAETLVVTAFVAGVLIYLFIQFTNLSNNYNDSYNYNTVEGLYSVRNIKNYILSDSEALMQLKNNLSIDNYIDMTDCSIFSEQLYCSKLLELENVNKIIITTNLFDKELFSVYDSGFKKFVNKIDAEGNEKYRILVEFNNSTYATIRFGE